MRKVKRLEAQLQESRQHMEQVAGGEEDWQQQGSRSEGAAGRSSTAAAAGGAPLTLRLLGCYDNINMDYDSTAQDDAMNVFKSKLDAMSIHLEPTYHFHRSTLREGLPVPENMLPAVLDSKEADMVATALLRHLLLHWLQANLWSDLLALMGETSHKLLLEPQEDASWAASTAEKEAALQLDAAAYRRLYKELEAWAPAGRFGQWQGREGWPRENLSHVYDTFCRFFLSALHSQADSSQLPSNSAQLARELFLQAYQLRLLMGAAHPELRPYLSSPGEPVTQPSKHRVGKVLKLPGASAGWLLFGRATSMKVLACRLPGWGHLFADPEAQRARLEEVVVCQV